MNRLIRFSFLILLLSACMPADLNAPSYDPYLDRAMGQQAVARSNAAIEATQAAESQQMAQATLQAAQEEHKTDQEIKRLEAEIKGTQSSVSAGSTQAAVAFAQDLATQQARVTQEAYVAAQTPAAATQTAMQRQIRIDEASEQRAKVMTWVLPIAGAIGILFIAWKIGEYFDIKAEIMRRNAAARESLEGTLIWVWDPEIEDYRYDLLRDTSLIRRLNAKSDFKPVGDVQFSPRKITATSSPGNGDRKLAIQLVTDAIGKVGEESDIIPGWRNLSGWTSERWSKAVKSLAEAGAVKTVEREGTYVQYDSLALLLYALKTDQLSPTPGG